MAAAGLWEWIAAIGLVRTRAAQAVAAGERQEQAEFVGKISGYKPDHTNFNRKQ
ncbi:MAG: hypothetical protein OXD30_01265 [Bryobacterales bacterium]|nr:hypothetical protein [Bryobacterales bacterium]